VKPLIKDIALIAGAYQLVAIAACLWFLSRKKPAARQPGISVLKPVRAWHAGLDQAVQSHIDQDYPEFEVLLGSREPIVGAILCAQEAPNAKVGVLMDMIKHARHPLIIVNDADITAPPGYFEEIAALLDDPRVGLVTCIYRAESDNWPGRWEALGVSTDFAPSTLVAPFVGVSEFALGATLAFRRADLDRIGGFAAVADYLADDYQLGKQFHALGLRNVMARSVVSTHLEGGSWTAVWRHQLRWARTIRVSRPMSYLGLPVTFATLWALIAALGGAWGIAAPLLTVRITMALITGWGVLRSKDTLRLLYLIPLRDLYAVTVWAAALFGSTVEWSDTALQLDRRGRIIGDRPL
jgi:ceramide glucosyltransferase